MRPKKKKKNCHSGHHRGRSHQGRQFWIKCFRHLCASQGVRETTLLGELYHSQQSSQPGIILRKRHPEHHHPDLDCRCCSTTSTEAHERRWILKDWRNTVLWKDNKMEIIHFFFKNNSIYFFLWLCWVFGALRAPLLLQCVGFSLFLQSKGSRAREGCSICRMWAQWLRISCMGRWILYHWGTREAWKLYWREEKKREKNQKLPCWSYCNQCRQLVGASWRAECCDQRCGHPTTQSPSLLGKAGKGSNLEDRLWVWRTGGPMMKDSELCPLSLQH